MKRKKKEEERKNNMDKQSVGEKLAAENRGAKSIGNSNDAPAKSIKDLTLDAKSPVDDKPKVVATAAAAAAASHPRKIPVDEQSVRVVLFIYASGHLRDLSFFSQRATCR